MKHKQPKNSGIFRERSARFVWEGVIRAVLCGLAVGFFVDFAVALATYAAGVDGLLASILAGVGAMAVSAPIFYFTLFRPRDEMMARRLDATGLDERLITMLEYRNADTEMAGLQRRDAMNSLRRVNPKRVPLRIVRFVVLAAVLAVFGTAMTAISTSAANGYFPTIDDITKPGDEENPDDPGNQPDDPSDPQKELQTYFTVTYLVCDAATLGTPTDPAATPGPVGGHIEWEASQLVIPGGNGVTVVAVADEGWAFQYWLEDESEEPSRKETGVTCDQTWTAVFSRTEEQDGGGGGGGGDGEDEENQSSSSSDSENTAPPGNNASGSFNQNNQIIDGETDYRQICDGDYFSDVKDGLGGDGSDDGSGGFADIYFDIIG